MCSTYLANIEEHPHNVHTYAVQSMGFAAAFAWLLCVFFGIFSLLFSSSSNFEWQYPCRDELQTNSDNNNNSLYSRNYNKNRCNNEEKRIIQIHIWIVATRESIEICETYEMCVWSGESAERLLFDWNSCSYTL